MYVPTGNELQKARKARGLTQTEVAERAGVSQPLLSRVENEDVDPRLSTLHSITQAINGSDISIDGNRLEVVVPSAIRELRKDMSLTQEDLAEEAGVSQPLIARIENNDVNPRASTLRSVLSVLNANPNERVPSDSQSSRELPDTEILSKIGASFERLPE
jgi:predicted transcriptional regulator